MVANGAESEPASRKDALLLVAGAAPRARRAVAGGGRAARAAGHRLRPGHAACRRRSAPWPSARARRLDPIDIEIVEAPDTFLAGQETAVVNQLGGAGAALPIVPGLTTIRERGVGGRPTLVQNVETLAHVALIARFGGGVVPGGRHRRDTRARCSLTVTRHDGPVIVEAVLGSSLRQSARVSDRTSSPATRGVLLGGYGGGWVSPRAFGELAVSEKAARRVGATLGAGVVALLPGDVCPLAEMADVVRYMEGQGAGQCGPCVHGLAELADVLERLAYGRPGAACAPSVSSRCATSSKDAAPAAIPTVWPGSSARARVSSPTRSTVAPTSTGRVCCPDHAGTTSAPGRRPGSRGEGW